MRLLFLSHSGDDKEYAHAIGAQLSDWGFESVFVYWDATGGIAGGADGRASSTRSCGWRER